MRPLQCAAVRSPQRTGVVALTTRVGVEAASSAICSFTPLHSRVPSWGHGTPRRERTSMCVCGGGVLKMNMNTPTFFTIRIQIAWNTGRIHELEQLSGGLECGVCL